MPKTKKNQALDLAPSNVNEFKKAEETALLFGCIHGHVDTVKQLLKAPGINVNLADKNEKTPLNWACTNGHADIVKKLLKAPGIDVNIADKDGEIALYRACANNHMGIIKQLLRDPGTNVNLINRKGPKYGIYGGNPHINGPLHWACVNANTEIVNLFLERPEININLRNYYEETPLLRACSDGYIDAARLFLKVPGINVNAANKIGQTSLHWACTNGHTGVVEQLLKEPEININIIDSYSQLTPLHEACSNGHTDIVKRLLKMPEININVKDKNGGTPLYYACARGHTNIVKRLLKMPEINVNITDNYGSTPLYLACNNQHANTVNELIKHILLKNPNEEKPHCLERNEMFALYWNQCRTEVFSLREGSNQKFLYDFCTMENKSKLETMSRNEKVQGIIKKENFIATYPLFGNEIKERFKKGLDRSRMTGQLLENVCLHDNVFSAEKNSQPNTQSKLRKLIRKKTPIEKVRLNTDVKRKILTHLDDSDLESLNEAISLKSNFSSEGSKVESNLEPKSIFDETWKAQGVRPRGPR